MKFYSKYAGRSGYSCVAEEDAVLCTHLSLRMKVGVIQILTFIFCICFIFLTVNMCVSFVLDIFRSPKVQRI